MLRNKIVYLCLLAYGIVFSILYDEYISILLLIVLVCIPFLLLGVLFLIAPYVTVELEDDYITVEKGDSFFVTIKVQNKSWFPVINGKVQILYGNQFGEKKSKEMVSVFTGGRSRQTVQSTLTSNHCGCIRVRCDSIQIYDYFRIFSIKKKVNKHINITVFPKFEEMMIEIPKQEHTLLEDSTVFSTIKPGDDPSQVFDIRDYREGDKIHRIHWKLSSKKEQYMVKEFSLPITYSTIILLDFCLDGTERSVYDYMDQLLESAFSLSYTLILHEHRHYLAWYHCKEERVCRFQIDEMEDIFNLGMELFNSKAYKDKEIFPRSYCEEFAGERPACIYYIGVAGTQYFEEFGLNPRKVEIYEG